MEVPKKKRKRKHKISAEKLGSIKAEFDRQRAERWPKMDIYIKLARVYGCGWQCIYNALKREKENKQIHLDIY